MTIYHKLGKIPNKRHVKFENPKGGLYYEEVAGLEGFSGIQSILYHLHLPTPVLKVKDLGPVEPKYLPQTALQHRAFATEKLPTGGDPISSRKVLLGNSDIQIGISLPDKSMDYFYRNALRYEMWFVHEGSGLLRSQYGKLPFSKGDYIVIPYGVTWKMELTSPAARFLTVECPSQIAPPKRYLNRYGQFLEHAPFCERDIKIPQELETIDEKGEFRVLIKVGDRMTEHVVPHHPFDVVGWDGYLYPWIFNIMDFMPITGKVHLPPPVHQTFEGKNFVVCSFVPRLFDYHPDAIPVPYNHSNINSDEVIYYCEGNFMSRKGIDRSDITLHPAGLPHGPQPGVIENSLGAKETHELAVMIDTFAPLQLTDVAAEIEKSEYMFSWLK